MMMKAKLVGFSYSSLTLSGYMDIPGQVEVMSNDCMYYISVYVTSPRYYFIVNLLISQYGKYILNLIAANIRCRG